MNIFRAHTKNAWGWVIEVYIILFWYFVCVHFILRDVTLVRRCSTGQTNHFSILPRPNVSAEYSLYCCSDKMSSHNTRRFFASIYTFSFSKFYVFFSDLISDFWSKKRQKDKKTKRQKDKKAKRQKYKKTKRQKSGHIPLNLRYILLRIPNPTIRDRLVRLVRLKRQK